MKEEYWMHGWIKSNMDIVLNEAIPNKWDALFIVFGKEGSGKTTFATQLAHYCNPNFNLRDCVFTPEQFEDRINSCEPESSIVWDEAITGASIGQQAGEVSQSIISHLTQIRKKRLKIFLCFPYLYMLNRYFIGRCLASFYIYAKDFDDRGYGYFYNQTQTEFLYNLMKERFRYSYMGAISQATKSFYFNFDKTFCLPEDSYDEKKEKSRIMKKETIQSKWKARFFKALEYSKQNGIPVKDMADYLKITPQLLYHENKQYITNKICNELENEDEQ